MLLSPIFHRWYTNLFAFVVFIINLTAILSSSNLFMSKNTLKDTDKLFKIYYHNNVVSEYDTLMQIKHINPDIFIYTNKTPVSDNLKQELSAFSSLNIAKTKNGEDIVFGSKYEALDIGHIPFNKNEETIATWATYEANNRVFTVIAVSMPPIEHLYKRANKDLIKYLQDFIISRDEPVVILGDFSSSPWSKYLRELKIKTNLTHKSGQTLSYPSYIPWFLRLSNFSLFAHEGIKIIDITTGAKTNSDHIPVISKIAIPRFN